MEFFTRKWSTLATKLLSTRFIGLVLVSYIVAFYCVKPEANCSIVARGAELT